MTPLQIALVERLMARMLEEHILASLSPSQREVDAVTLAEKLLSAEVDRLDAVEQEGDAP